MRLAQRRRGEQPRQLMNNGNGRWLRMVEKRLRDGSMVAIRVDVTDFETQRRALELTQRDLARSRQRLEDAIEAMPAGFELYDADDRLVMVNRMNLQMYPLLADLVDQRPTFEQVVRTNAARGGLPLLRSRDQARRLDRSAAARAQESGRGVAASDGRQPLDSHLRATHARRWAGGDSPRRQRADATRDRAERVERPAGAVERGPVDPVAHRLR